MLNKHVPISYTDDYKRNAKFIYRYGITLNDYNNLFAKQNGCCAICNKHQIEFKQNLSLDHCHKTNNIRGLLCKNCNSGLGKFKDSCSLLNEAKSYLENSFTKKVNFIPKRYLNKKEYSLAKKENIRAKLLWLDYKISLSDYNTLLQIQNNCCAICNTNNNFFIKRLNSHKLLSVDHCHTTKNIRGLLCDNCNSGLGLFKDSLTNFINAINYISNA